MAEVRYPPGWFIVTIDGALRRAGIVGKVKVIRRTAPPHSFSNPTWSVVLEDGREYEFTISSSLSPLVPETAPEEAAHA